MKNINYDALTIINNMNIKILGHGHLFANKEWKYYNVNSPYNRLYFILDGRGIIKNNKQEVNLIPNYIYLIPCHSTFSYICNDYMEKLYFHFCLEIFPGEDIFKHYNELMYRPVSEFFIKNFIDKIKSNHIKDIIICKSILLETIASFADFYSENVSEKIKIGLKYKDVFKYLSDNCFANVTIKDIADYVNLSPSALSKNFKKDTGQTLKNYLHQKLIQRSKEKLLLTNMTVKEIAGEMKFSDEYYFSRFFKKHVGVSPTEYRKINKMI